MLLSQARWINSKFHPEHVIADSAYSSEKFRTLVRRQYRATPIIKPNPSHKKAVKCYPETPDWQLIYNRRTCTERLFSRLKGHRKLNSIRVRGIRKVSLHCLMSVVVVLAQAIATGLGTIVRSVTKLSCLKHNHSLLNGNLRIARQCLGQTEGEKAR